MVTTATLDPSKSVHIMDLNNVTSGKTVTVVAIKAEQELLGRLMGLGIFVGTKLVLFRGGKTQAGPLLLGVENTRIALGREIAKSILVEES